MAKINKEKSRQILILDIIRNTNNNIEICTYKVIVYVYYDC